MDDVINEFVPDQKYRNKNELAPKWPARIIVIAPSGGGKTNIVMNLIMDYLDFDKIYIYVKDLHENKYQFLIPYMQCIEKKYNEENDCDENIIVYSDDPNDIVELEDLDKKKQNLIIIDDAVLDKKMNEKVVDLFKRCRKRNSTIIYQSQSYFDMEKFIRLNANYLVLLNLNNKRELNEIAKTYACDIEFKQLRKLYEQCTNEPYGFMLIDMETQDKPFMKYRCKFDGLYNPTNESS